MINRKIKRAVSLCTVTVMAATLVGCGAKEQAESQGAASSEGQTDAETTVETEPDGETENKAADGVKAEYQNLNSSVKATNETPNILLIVMDDMGFSDLGSFGSEIHTPNLDKLAENGLRYNNFHVTPVSSPTRAALLTGRNSHSVGMSRLANYDLGVPHSTGNIPENAAFVSQIVQDAGYNTMAVGKWHLTPGWALDAAGPYENWPLQRGFERYYGFLDAEADQYNPEIVYDNHKIDIERDEDYHMSADLADHAIEFLQDQQTMDPDKPFMMYFATGAMHKPIQAPQEYIDKYDGVYDVGWDAIRENRFVKQKEMGLVPENADLAPLNNGVKAWDELTLEERELFVAYQETYAGFLEYTDTQIGRVIDEIDRYGELDNTMIVFMSDNGSSPEGAANGVINTSNLENGIKYTVEENVARMDTLGEVGSAIPAGWAQVSCTPFSYYKFSADYLGGIRVPMIVQYPKMIGEDLQGGIRKQFVDVIDVSSTYYDILGITYPEVFNGLEQMSLQGISFKDTFTQPETESLRKTQYFEMFGTRGLYHEGWFLASNHEKGADFAEDTWRLYNLEEDFTQQHDISAENPEKVEELAAVWEVEAEKYGVNPLDDKVNAQLIAGQVRKDIDNRNDMILYPGVSMLNINTTVYWAGYNRSYSMDAYISRDDASEQGVLLAVGSDEGGYSFYIKDNYLVYEYNYMGESTIVRSEAELPVDCSVVTAEYQKNGETGGTIVLKADGTEVGTGAVPMTYPFMPSTTDGASVGKDSGAQVSREYVDQGVFEFTGELEKIHLQLESDYNKAS